MRPSELLVAAADRIRDLAAEAQRGPWVFDEGTDRVMVDDTQHSVTCFAGADHDDSQWIAALSPAIAPALEEWLRDEAREIEPHEDTINPDWAALRLARAIVPGEGA